MAKVDEGIPIHRFLVMAHTGIFLDMVVFSQHFKDCRTMKWSWMMVDGLFWTWDNLLCFGWELFLKFSPSSQQDLTKDEGPSFLCKFPIRTLLSTLQGLQINEVDYRSGCGVILKSKPFPVFWLRAFFEIRSLKFLALNSSCWCSFVFNLFVVIFSTLSLMRMDTPPIQLFITPW